MRNIFLIFVNCLRRNRIMMLIALVTAFLLVGCFFALSRSGLGSDAGKIHVGVVDNDSSALSLSFTDYLTSSLNMEATTDKSYDELSKLLIDGKISVIIEIPEGFLSSAVRGVYKSLTLTTLDDYENSAFIEAYVNTYMQSVSVLSDAAEGDEGVFLKMLENENMPYSVEVQSTISQTEIKEKARDAFTFSQGFLLMVISGITIFISYTIMTDKESGTYGRIQCTSITPAEYVIGVGLLGIVCCSLMNLVYVFSVFIRGVPLYFTPVFTFLLNEVFILFSVGIAIAFALCLRSKSTLLTVGIGYTTIGCMLGGAWFPISGSLGALSNLAKLLPHYWFMDIMRKAPAEASYSCLPNICILLLFVLFVYLISAVIFTKKSS